MMRKTTLLILLLIASVAINAQTYVVGFSASGASQSIDSVEILNLTKNISLSVGGADTLYLIDTITSIANKEPHTGKLHVFPNPTNHACHLIFSNKAVGGVKIRVYDIQGRVIIHKNEYLEKGTYQYLLSGLKTGVYIIHVFTVDAQYISRLIATGNQNAAPSLSFISFEKGLPYQQTAKSTKAKVYFLLHNPGDLLLFKGTSGIYGRVIAKEVSADEIIDFEFIPCTDADSNHYAVLTIGQQTWMHENLATTKYITNTPISNDTNAVDWTNTAEGAYVWYNNSPNYKVIYGALYNWHAIHGDSLCPYGWYMPDTLAWQELINHVGSELTAGGILKQTETQHWQIPNTGATNEVGFTALPGGYREFTGIFGGISETGNWWSRSAKTPDTSWVFSMSYTNAEVRQNSTTNNTGFSVRCLLNCTNPYVDAGSDATICKNANSYSPEAISSNYSSLEWTTNGDGSFSDVFELNAVYYFGPGDYGAGNVQLVLTAQPINNCAVQISDTVSITLAPLPQISALSGQYYCQGDTVDLIATATNCSEVEWICDVGHGIIEDDALAQTRYFPTILDWFRGYIDFIVRAYALTPCTEASEAYVRVYFHNAPEADAGPDQLDISGTTTTMLGNDPPLGGSGLWSMTGSGGSFNDATDPETSFAGLAGVTYMPIWTVTDANGCTDSDTVLVRFTSQVPDGAPCPGTPTMTDADGNVYNTVKIGNQCWIKENLKNTSGLTYCSSSQADKNIWSGYPNYVSAPPAYGWINDDPVNYGEYGAMYNWYAVNTGTLCPSGWTVSSKTQWEILHAYLGGSGVSGGKVKEAGFVHWSAYAGYAGGNNLSGFTAFGGGARHPSGDYESFKIYGRYWTSTNATTSDAYSFTLYHVDDGLSWGTRHKRYGCSVRCMKIGGITMALSITTNEVTHISANAAKSGGVITQNGGATVNQRGIVWSKIPNPSISINQGISYNQTGSGAFVHNMVGLDSNATYYVRAYAINNNQDTAYGSEITFNTNVPDVVYHSVGDITATTAKSGGTVSTNGGAQIQAYGLIWSSQANVNINNYEGITTEGAGIGVFQSVMTKLSPSTTYYVRAYAKNNIGIGYGDEMSFQTSQPGIGEQCIGITSLIDPRDGQVYQVVGIGNRCWMAENLKYLPEVHSFYNNSMYDTRYYVNNYYGSTLSVAQNLPNYQNYGVLYNHLAALAACPPGWTLPTKSEWDDLLTHIYDGYLYGGNELRSCRGVNSPLGGNCNTTTHPRWNAAQWIDFVHGTDDYGFAALPGGYVVGQSGFGSVNIIPGSTGKWWTATSGTGNDSYGIEINSISISTFFWQTKQWNGLSVRCVKN